ncbi:MAG: OB-fold domain-containing protein [Deltaproteobacteria bacterium]|nr:OB-fold domain-containing protein [Deltaproteobacteria bacterium]
MSLSGKEREEFEKQLEAYVGIDIGIEDASRDAVNQAMIRQWCEAMGDACGAYTAPEAAAKSVHGEVVAPPAMLQAWILGGVAMATGEDDPRDKQRELHRLFDARGYTGVVATNTEQEYLRYLKLGDRIRARTQIESISEQKATGLGIGYFINTRTRFVDQNDKEVGWMTFRVLKFEAGDQPAAAAESDSAVPAKPQRLRPALGHDNRWWWDCVEKDELAIQRCSACAVLRHPPRPMCGECQSTEWDYVFSSGEGTIHSYVVIRHPEVPGYTYPLVVAVVDLAEGTRFVGNVVDIEPEEVEIGMAVQASIERVDDEMKLPVFRRAS